MKQLQMCASISNAEKARLTNILDITQKRQCSPSEVFELIRKNASHWISENDLKEIWMLGLPINIRYLLITLPVEIQADLNQFVAAADDIFFELEKPPLKVKQIEESNTTAKCSPHKNASSNVIEPNRMNKSAKVLELEETLQQFNRSKKRKPSEVLQRLRNLTSSQPLPHNIMKEIWLSSLPEEVFKEMIKLPADVQGDFKCLSVKSDRIFKELESRRLKRAAKSPAKHTKNVPSNKLVGQNEASSSNAGKSTQFKAEPTDTNKNQPIDYAPTPQFFNSLLSKASSSQTDNVDRSASSNINASMDSYCHLDPEIIELKDLLRAYNKDLDKRPLELLNYLKKIVINKTCNWTNRSFTPLHENVIKDICLSSLPPQLFKILQTIPFKNQKSWNKFQDVATRFFTKLRHPNSIADKEKKINTTKKKKLENNGKKGRGNGIGLDHIAQTKLNSFDGFYSLALDTYEHEKVGPQNTRRELKNAKGRMKTDDAPKKVKFHKKNETTRLDDLLSDFKQTGNRKPSEMLKFLRQDTATKFKDDILKLIWLSHLPEQIKSFLSTGSETLDELAINADDIYEKYESNSGSKTSIKSESTTEDLLRKMKMLLRTVEILSDKLESLNVNVDDITSEINEMTSSNQSCCSPEKPTAYSPIDSYRRNRRKKPEKELIYRKDPDICYFHRMHGSASKKCEPPCYFMTVVSKIKWRRSCKKMDKQKTQKYPFTIEYKKQISQFIETKEDMGGI